MRNGYHPSHNAHKKETYKDQGFYKTKAWQRIRLLALQRDHYLCQLKLSPQCTVMATEVHHILPLEEYPDKGLALDNLTCCCWNCHEMTKDHNSLRPRVPAGVRVIKIDADG